LLQKWNGGVPVHLLSVNVAEIAKRPALLCSCSILLIDRELRGEQRWPEQGSTGKNRREKEKVIFRGK
jgi:hypothetical protein